MRSEASRLRCAGLCLWLAAFGLSGCVTTAGRPSAAPVPHPGDLAPEAVEGEGRRQLFRVGYQGPGGSGSLRLALLESGPAFYQAKASDAFGRGLWSLALAGNLATFVDHRQRRYCVTEQELRIPELALGSLALDRLPVVLAGEIPAAARRTGDDPGDFVDVEGRRWTARREQDVLQAWTLWQDGRPLLWWQRREQGGMLSHRDGAQFRWRRSVVEPLPEAPPALAIPTEYLAVDCQDLSAPPETPG